MNQPNRLYDEAGHYTPKGALLYHEVLNTLKRVADLCESENLDLRDLSGIFVAASQMAVAEYLMRRVVKVGQGSGANTQAAPEEVPPLPPAKAQVTIIPGYSGIYLQTRASTQDRQQMLSDLASLGYKSMNIAGKTLVSEPGATVELVEAALKNLGYPVSVKKSEVRI
jgi:hypothetical protein